MKCRVSVDAQIAITRLLGSLAERLSILILWPQSSGKLQQISEYKFVEQPFLDQLQQLVLGISKLLRK